MKMEYPHGSPAAGLDAEVFVTAGQAVEKGAPLLRFVKKSKIRLYPDALPWTRSVITGFQKISRAKKRLPEGSRFISRRLTLESVLE